MNSLSRKMWDFLKSNIITRNYMRSLEKSITILFPQNRKVIEQQMKLYLLKKFIVFVAIIVFMGVFNSEAYWLIGAAIIGWLITMVWHKAWVNKINIRMLKDLQVFVSDISFAYRCTGELEEAFRQVLLDTTGLMKLHGELIYELISGSEYEDSYRDYKEIAPNEYFLLFYAISHKTKQEGDTELDGRSLYNDNLIMLGQEISRQLLYLEKTKNAFAGLMGMCVCPIFFIKPIENWTLSNMPELEGYFQSVESKLMSVIVIIISMLILWVITILKYPGGTANYKKEVIAKIINIPEIYQYLNKRIIKRYGYYLKLWRTIKEACVSSTVMEFCVERYLCVLVGCIPAFLMAVNIGINIGVCIAIALVGCFGGWWYPYIILKVRAFAIKSSLSEELIRFYTIIGMSKNQENIDIRELLVQLELISIYYEEALKDAVNSYEGSGIVTLHTLKNMISDKYASRLIDGLIACDELEISDALSFVESEREYLIAGKHIKDEKSLSDRSAISKFMAFIPFLATILIKLIVPFIIEGLNQLQSFSSALQTF